MMDNKTENKEEMQEQDDFSEDSETGKLKQWFQDNLRIIISVLIVVVIAGGIYSYSNRSQAPTTTTDEQSGMISEITGDEEKATPDNTQTTEVKGDQETTKPKQEQVSSTATSQETDNSFVETAAPGDGTTKLARRALANYLEKNPDSSLTPEHKIYIEDYLRKKVGYKGAVRVGTSVEFRKDLVQEAITKSKSLNENQLKNLHKYAVRVPSLT